jgi:hypothetical protein
MTKQDRKVTFDKRSIPLNDIKGLSKDKKRQLLMITLMMSDLNLLQKFMIFSVKALDRTDPIKVDENMTTYLFLLRKLVSKAHEMWEFIKRHKLQSSKRNLALKTCQDLSVLEQFYDGSRAAKTFNFIRNKFGFHYEWLPDVEAEIEKGMHVQDFEMLLSNQDTGNNIFPSSNRVMLGVILNEMMKNGYKGNTQELISQLIHDALEASKFFSLFYTSYLILDVLRDVDVNKVGEACIEAPLMSEVSLPLIVKKG